MDGPLILADGASIWNRQIPTIADLTCQKHFQGASHRLVEQNICSVIADSCLALGFEPAEQKVAQLRSSPAQNVALMPRQATRLVDGNPAFAHLNFHSRGKKLFNFGHLADERVRAQKAAQRQVDAIPGVHGHVHRRTTKPSLRYRLKATPQKVRIT